MSVILTGEGHTLKIDIFYYEDFNLVLLQEGVMCTNQKYQRYLNGKTFWPISLFSLIGDILEKQIFSLL